MMTDQELAQFDAETARIRRNILRIQIGTALLVGFAGLWPGVWALITR